MCYSDIKSDREDFEMLLLNQKRNILVATDILSPVNTQTKIYFPNEAIAALQNMHYQKVKSQSALKTAIELAQFQGLEHHVLMPIVHYDKSLGTYRLVKDNDRQFTNIEHNLMLAIPVYKDYKQAEQDFADIIKILNKQTLRVRLIILNLDTYEPDAMTVDYQKAGYFDQFSGLHALLPERAGSWSYLAINNLPNNLLNTLSIPTMEIAMEQAKKDPRTNNKTFYLSGAAQLNMCSCYDFQGDLAQLQEYPLINEDTYQVGRISSKQAKMIGWTDLTESDRIISSIVKRIDKDPVKHRYGFDDIIEIEQEAMDESGLRDLFNLNDDEE